MGGVTAAIGGLWKELVQFPGHSRHWINPVPFPSHQWFSVLILETIDGVMDHPRAWVICSVGKSGNHCFLPWVFLIAHLVLLGYSLYHYPGSWYLAPTPLCRSLCEMTLSSHPREKGDTCFWSCVSKTVLTKKKIDNLGQRISHSCDQHNQLCAFS